MVVFSGISIFDLIRVATLLALLIQTAGWAGMCESAVRTSVLRTGDRKPTHRSNVQLQIFDLRTRPSGIDCGESESQDHSGGLCSSDS